MENTMEVPQKAKNKTIISCDPAIPLLVKHPGETTKSTCTRILAAALCIRAKT